MFLVSKIWLKLKGDEYVAVYFRMFLKKSLWLSEVKVFHIDELWEELQKRLAMAHFEEDDEEEFWEIGRKSSAKDILLTFATDFQTEAPVWEYCFLNCSWPN